MAAICLLLMLYRSWWLPELFPMHRNAETNGIVHSEDTVTTTDDAAGQPVASVPSEHPESIRISRSVLPKDPAAAEIAELRTAVEELEHLLVTPQPVDFSELEDP